MNLEVGDKVDLIIGRISKLGFTVLINKEYEGLLYKNELYVKLEEGDNVVGYIKKIREDGGIDVSLQPIGFKNTLVENEIKILDALKKSEEGFLGLHDKSSPDDIKYQMNMSKKAFKSAIGGLYRLKLISLEPEGIRMVKH
ncbi:S1 RNA-binding domain-containing protein [Urechidicola croceus]|uniref:DNA-binding protein n=1 Tax=Urechidicola croceus TaxID=1850246 RepID=A0A1D8P3T9_9FLAO|nr:DNA-binding protein [Urechidicola croceus]AOW19252.1 DNA-binding protein [Urechidicola croceus]